MADAFRPGEAIAWRSRLRIDATRVGHPYHAIAMTVVHDTPRELALFRRPGHPIKRRNAEHAGTAHMRHQPVTRWLDGWADEVWSRSRVLVLMVPDVRHAISLYWDDASGALDCWYIDLIGPVRRTPVGFDYPEHDLDIVVRPDLSAWEWKDEDELEWAVADGRYTRAEADALHVEGERAVERLLRDRARFERWLDWRPDPTWPLATLPAGWDAL